MRSIPLALTLISFPLCVAADLIPGSNIVVGNWSGGAFTYNGGEWDGWFSHCVVSAPFLSGDNLYFSVNEDVTVSIGVESRTITQPVGTLFPVTVYVDRIPPFYGDAEVVIPNLATLTFRDFDAAMNSLQRGQTLTIETLTGARQFDLTDSFRALEAARTCVATYYGYRFPPSSPPEAPQVATVPEAQTDPALLYQIATEMIAEMKVSDFRYFTQNELNELGFANSVFWTSGLLGVTGGVMLAQAPPDGNLRSTDGGDLAAITGGCEGEVATTATNVSLDQFEARQLRALCVADAYSSESLVTKILVGDSVLYTILLFDDQSGNGRGANRDVVSEDVALRAANYVLKAQ
jgi:hypothetical protein